ncbi:hypothetical protein [Virgibacillus halodenitrificans]|uniref:hypothetical protein n=1 Tax=Virgibacillus halodenitrificans TaxID=1482 RepID=UPI000EF4CAA4|nr:hypothetical protein [Virgibacillus halodenitrificans]
MKKPLKKALIGSLLVSTTITLSACGGANRLVEEAEEVTEKNTNEIEVETEQQDKNYEEKVKQWGEMYAEYGEQSREETLEHIEKESVGPVNEEPIIVKESYTDPDELASFASDILFNFYRGDTHANDYVVFIENYGSEESHEMFLTGKHKEDVKLMSSVQSRIREQGIEYSSYQVSKVQKEGNIGVFYRKLTTSTGLQEFYRTELIKEDGHWYFHNDGLSEPVAFD